MGVFVEQSLQFADWLVLIVETDYFQNMSDLLFNIVFLCTHRMFWRRGDVVWIIDSILHLGNRAGVELELFESIIHHISGRIVGRRCAPSWQEGNSVNEWTPK